MSSKTDFVDELGVDSDGSLVVNGNDDAAIGRL